MDYKCDNERCLSCMYVGGHKGYRPSCDYILIEGHTRGCSVLNCDKYKPGKAKRKRRDLGQKIMIKTIEIKNSQELAKAISKEIKKSRKKTRRKF